MLEPTFVCLTLDSSPLAHSAMEKLKNLRMNVSQLLSLVLPHLELQDVNYESDQVDEILQTVLETNRMSE